ncbi:signal peptide protein [Legionella quinlivanii]|uniref:Signal peptide protein n=1 Tax=Legionella quinlivanii TaxID=45073 RepID=A0A0W0Y1P3_9GAMM|nr:DUF2282 domain-containing protein [Legionella quinlivanii]KTD50467.1 signal peptide protein [Legionella quinlivanii]MCW8449780.1 DUF2282 domain-containing protein [Legionella quinlivanii]SEF39592.1 Uncharacterized membrane protein [Legionella quinlivanii DSM 21216]STY12067.1 signal peptide protein [Legionella quinlivanii]
MINKDKLVQSAITAFLVLSSSHSAIAASETTDSGSNEKCYGIVKAGMNDCSTATSSCAGSATKDSQPDAFVFMPKGLCDKLVGGSLKSETKPAS